MNQSNQPNTQPGLASQTLDLSAGLGYGLLYQPILSSDLPQSQFMIAMQFLHRRLKSAKSSQFKA